MRPKTDTLGDRMKAYEEATRYVLPRRTYTILRVDGRAFHTWTHGLARPYDINLMTCMDDAAVKLCEEISGTQFAFVQSDEISLLAVDFADIKTQPWFDGVIQKWTSVAAAVAAVGFNAAVISMKLSAKAALEMYTSQTLSDERSRDWVNSYSQIAKKTPNAVFDARVFTIPDPVEVENYFVWRQKDAVRNSVTMLAQMYASHKQLQNKDVPARHEIIHAAGDNWAKHPANFKHGRVVRKSTPKEWGHDLGPQPSPDSYHVGNWFVDNETPVFTRDRNYLRNLVPLIWENDLIVRKAAEK